MRTAVSVTVALALFAAAPAARAQSVLYATDGQNLFAIDTQSFAVTAIGPMALTSAEPFHGGLEADGDGTLWSMSGQKLYRVDPSTGQTTGLGPYGVGFVFEGSVAFHPTTGAAYGANAGSSSAAELFRIDKGTGQGTLLGQFPGATHDFNGLAFDASGQMYGIDRPSDSLWRIDHTNPGGPGTVPVGGGLGAGIVLGPSGGLTYDASTGTFWGYAGGTHALFTVDPTTGVGTVKKLFDGTVPGLFGLASEGCATTFAYGAGCAGSGGFVPQLDLVPCGVQTGQPVQLVISDALGGAQGLLVFGLTQGSLPMDAGCALLVQPLVGPILALPLGGVGAGNGGAILSTVLPAGLTTPLTFTMQLFVADAGGAASFSNSRGLQVTVDV